MGRMVGQGWLPTRAVSTALPAIEEAWRYGLERIEVVVIERPIRAAPEEVHVIDGPGDGGRIRAQREPAHQLRVVPGRPAIGAPGVVRVAVATDGENVEPVYSPGRDGRCRGHVGGNPAPVRPGLAAVGRPFVVQSVVSAAAEDV